ncbi:unnamed protein product [Euphydryas editha]|uniref:Uncharacterized protein n=1 Tax=Euphydryas editha TaxID=104508 RepID=A0AAU9TYL6_EUPED|nr:unnamed protein product [Euphydryas editha]
MSDPSVFLNCSMPAINYGLHEDIVHSSFNMTRIESAIVAKVAGFGAVSGVLVALLINFLFHFEYEVFKKKVKIKNRMPIKKMFLLIILTLILPFMLLFLLVAFSYKILCYLITKRKDKHFAGFLESFDVFWCLEDDASKSIVTVLGVIEFTSSQDLFEHIRENPDAEKLFYRRNEAYGFYYWKKCRYIDISQYVRIIDVSNVAELSVSDLEEVMTEISYQRLPFNDEGLFQVLITNQKLKNIDNGKDEYGVIIRIHHAADILISSLSWGLRDYFIKKINPVPNTVAVIFQIRFPQNKSDGLGITALGYDGVLRFVAMADSAIISSSGELDIILNGMVKGIKRLNKKYIN